MERLSFWAANYSNEAKPELCLDLGDGVGVFQAAAFSWLASMPSMNVTPVITFGN